jgi:AcrR family transcriptional regulator
VSSAAPVRLDGRNARAERSRTAVVDALLDLLGEGELRPPAARIAERAGVSLRSVFQHFADIETLYGAAADRQIERLGSIAQPCSARGTREQRLDAFVRARTRLLETIAPVRRGALLMEPFSTEIATRLARGRAHNRAEVEAMFAPELAARPAATRRELASALSAAASWSTWEHLRRHQGLSRDRARRVVARTLAALLDAAD